MREHKVYYGFLKNDHYFVEVKPGDFDEWNVEDVRDIAHVDIVKWNLRERASRDKHILMRFPYIKQGCGATVKLLKTIKRKGVIDYAYERS